MLKKGVSIFIVLLFFTALSFAEPVFVDYIDGYLDVNIDGEWYEVFPGDELTASDVIKLDDDSIVELTDGKTTITITQAGTYAINDLLSASSKMTNVGLTAMMGEKFKNLVTGAQTENPDVAGGARASDYASDEAFSLDFMDSISGENIDAGKALLEEDDLLGAYEQFNMALDTAIDYDEFAEIDEAKYYLAYIHALQGEKGYALSKLSDVAPLPDVDYYVDLYIFKGQLLIESFSFQAAVDWLDTFEDISYGQDTENIQLIALLQGVGYYGLGNTYQAKKYLQNAYNLDSDSPAAMVADNYLKDL